MFIHPTTNKRRILYLGHTPAKTCDTIKGHVEAIVAAMGACGALDLHTAKWLGDIKDDLHGKLARLGLVAPRVPAEDARLERFIDQYTAKRTDVKPATKEIWGQGKRGLVEFFGADKPLADITPGGADDYKLKLVGAKLAPMTIRKRLQFAKMIFRAAVRHRLIAADPFAEVNVKASMPDRRRFVSTEDTAKLLEACPSQDWRTIIALARYGGLRCPSEVLSVKWADVDVDAGRIRVTSPKTEHHPGKESRMIPLFPELREELRRAYELAPEGAVYVVDARFRKGSMGPNGWRNCNLRTTFEKIIGRAGLTVWPRMFHNLRSTRQTELSEKFPSHVVCAWLGNSLDVAREHYLQVTDQHFEKASNNPTQNPTQSAAVAPRKAREAKRATARNTERNATLRHRTKRKTDGEGFEPPVRFPVQQFSRLPP